MTGVCANCTIWMDRDYTHANGDDERTNSSTPDIYKTRYPIHYWILTLTVTTREPTAAPLTSTRPAAWNTTTFRPRLSTERTFSSLPVRSTRASIRLFTLWLIASWRWELECIASIAKTSPTDVLTIASDSVVVSQIWFDVKLLFHYSIYIASLSQRDILGLLSSHIWFDVKVLFR